jgi:transcriptional regulator with XRE-family HTH domain
MELIPQTDIDRQIAARLKRRRTDLGMTLDQLAERSGVSRAMISKIERMEASATASLLGRLTAALGITLAVLFAEEKPSSPLTRRARQPEWRDPETGYLRRNLTPFGAGLPVGMVEVEFPAGASVSFDVPMRPVVHQLVWVLEGELTIGVGEADYQLGTGDSFAMTIDGLHRFENRSAVLTRYVLALSSANGRALEI